MYAFSRLCDGTSSPRLVSPSLQWIVLLGEGSAPQLSYASISLFKRKMNALYGARRLYKTRNTPYVFSDSSQAKMAIISGWNRHQLYMNRSFLRPYIFVQRPTHNRAFLDSAFDGRGIPNLSHPSRVTLIIIWSTITPLLLGGKCTKSSSKTFPKAAYIS